MYDVVIIGHGPAGLSASIFAARAGLQTLVVGSGKKSQLIYAKNIRNYFGFPDGVDGNKLLDLGMKQAKNCGAKLIEGEVVDLKKSKYVFFLKTADGKMLKAKAVIISTGIPIRWAGVKNEKELIGRGVHTCASCDGPMYRNKKIAVIGNGSHAAEDALELTSYSRDITMISQAKNFAFAKKFAGLLKKNKIKFRNAVAKEFVADRFLKKIIFEDGSEEGFDGAFLACGTAGSLDFAAKLGIEIRENLLVVDENSMTNVSGVFSAGNCMGKCRQIAKNVGDGCNAGISVIRYLKAKEIYFDYAKD